MAGTLSVKNCNLSAAGRRQESFEYRIGTKEEGASFGSDNACNDSESESKVFVTSSADLLKIVESIDNSLYVNLYLKPISRGLLCAIVSKY